MISLVFSIMPLLYMVPLFINFLSLMTDIPFDISNITFSGIVSIWLNKSLFDSLITYFIVCSLKSCFSVLLSIYIVSSTMVIVPLPV